MAALRSKDRQRQRQRDQRFEGGQPRADPPGEAAARGGPQQPARQRESERSLGAAEQDQQFAHQHHLRGYGGEADQNEDGTE